MLYCCICLVTMCWNLQYRSGPLFLWPLTSHTSFPHLPNQNWSVHAMRWSFQPRPCPLAYHEPQVRRDAERGQLRHVRHVPDRLQVPRGVWGHILPPAPERPGVKGPPRLHLGLCIPAEGIHSNDEVRIIVDI